MPQKYQAKLSMIKKRISDLLLKYETRLEIAFFVGGFIFDIWMLSAPDEIFSVLQQIFYLLVIASLIHFELLHRLQTWRPHGLILKFWPYRTLVLHFFLGSLLSVYSLFYIKSASFFSSIVFLLFMIGLLLANEFPLVKKANVSIKVGLYAICLFSFLSILFPILFGFVGFVPFLFSLSFTFILFYLQFMRLRLRIPDQKLLARVLMAPAGAVLTLFFVFYFLGWIPPVPLSVKAQGIYHFIEKKNNDYLLSFEPNWLGFLSDEDDNFNARPGDKIYYFAQIYSPARISDEVVIHWYQKNKKNNWELMDKIPLQTKGGREQGFRGFATKSNYTAGSWKIEVRTSSGIEISRLYFDVNLDSDTSERNFKIITR